MSLKCDEISLWCDAESQDDKKSDKKARKKNGGISVRLKEDDHFTVFTEMHGNEFSIPQQRLWAQTINCGTHDSFEIPPALSMFAPPPKQRFKDSLTDTVAAVLAKAISPGTANVKDASRLDPLPLTTSGKKADL